MNIINSLNLLHRFSINFMSSNFKGFLNGATIMIHGQSFLFSLKAKVQINSHEPAAGCEVELQRNDQTRQPRSRIAGGAENPKECS